MTHRSGALSLLVSHRQKTSVNVTFCELVMQGVEGVVEDCSDLAIPHS